MAEKVELAELIQHVADQLRAVNAPPESDEAPVMQFTEAEIEMGISIEKKAGGGLKVWVLELGGGRTKADTTTVNVKFSAIPGQGVIAFLQGITAPGDVPDAAAISKASPLKPPGAGGGT